jgi:hypothetical protein
MRPRRCRDVRAFKRLLPLLVPLFLSLPAARSQVTLQELGIPTRHGALAYPFPQNVAPGLYDPDRLLDVARLKDGLLGVYRNLGNGTYQQVYETRLARPVASMKWRKEEMLGGVMEDPESWGYLELTYTGGGTERFDRERMEFRAASALAFQPAGPTAYPPLRFRDVWKSRRNPLPGQTLLVADIDQDGRLNFVYVSAESVWGQARHLYVFEATDTDSLRVEWDTVFARGTQALAITNIDRDSTNEIALLTWFDEITAVSFLEFLGPTRTRLWRSNIAFTGEPRIIHTAQQADVDHDGVRELCVLTSGPNVHLDPTIIPVAEYFGKGPGPGGVLNMGFNSELARYQGYVFRLAVGQVDGEGRDELIPSGGSFGVGEPCPVDYLWYCGVQGPDSWWTRGIHTGLQSGSDAVKFANLDGDSTLELALGAPGPVGNASVYALDYLRDTTWRVMWVDSTLRSSPPSITTGPTSRGPVVASVNTWNLSPLDTVWTELRAYSYSGAPIGVWHRDSMSFKSHHIADIDGDGRANVVFARLSIPLGNYLVNAEEDSGFTFVGDPPELPAGVELFQNFPNPFNPSTAIPFSVDRPGEAQLTIYDILGREIARFQLGELPAGTHAVRWDGTTNRGEPAASGVYFYRLAFTHRQGVDRTEVRKMILTR